ncbi:hypothetical protein D3C77_716790 [compost metagenome]
MRRAGEGIEPQARQPLFHVRLGDHLIDRGIQFGHDLRRHAGRAEVAVPGVEVEILHAGLGHGRQVRDDRAAFGGRHRQGAQLARLHEGQT